MRLRHHHDELELNLVLRGTAAYLLGDRVYHLERQSLLWLFPEQEHLLADQSPDYEMWVVVFKPELVRRTCGDSAEARPLIQADPAGWFCRRLSRPQAGRLDTVFTEIEAAVGDAAFINAGLAYALMAAWAAFRSGEDIPPGTAVHPGVECAVQALRQGLHATDLPRLAHRCGLSASHLSRLFKKQVGIPLVEFRNRQRLERVLSACDRPRGPTLLGAALDAGFGSYAQFHRVFKRIMGCGPVAYRRLGVQAGSDHERVSP
jgi:AraC-like DNA-binding protein